MRVLHVDPARSWRGGERQVFLLARELESRGVDCLIAASPRGVLWERATRAGLSTLPQEIRGDVDPFAVTSIAGQIRRLRPDILHVHTARAHAAGGLAARLSGFQKTLVTRRLELPIRGPFSRWKYRVLGDHYIAISRAVESALTRGGVPAERIDRIPSGIDLPERPWPERARGRAWTVGTLAALTPQKDPATWVETVQRVCAQDGEIRFLWAGDGELAAAATVAIERAGLSSRVEFLGFVEDPEPFWRRIDTFFLPSAFEGLGTVLLDALVRGVPVVATSAGGIPEIVREDQEGLLSAPGDVEGLAGALLRIRREEKLGERLSRAGRERGAEFEIGKVVDRIMHVYERLASR